MVLMIILAVQLLYSLIYLSTSMFKAGGALSLPSIDPPQNEDVYKTPTAFGRLLATYEIFNFAGMFGVAACMQAKKEIMLDLLKYEISIKKSIKSNIWVESTYTNVHDEFDVRAFKSKNIALCMGSDLVEFMDATFEKIMREEDEYQGKKSGWTLYSVDKITLNINAYLPFTGNK